MKHALLAAAAASACAASAAANVTTTWDSGTFEGWTFAPDPTGAGTWEVFAAGGNPDGYVSYVDGPDGFVGPVFLFAPDSYDGDYSSFGPGAGFSFDGIWESTSFDPINGPVVRIFGAGGEVAEGVAAGVNSTGWDSFFIDFDASSWNMINGDFNDLISDVVDVALIGDNGIGAGREAGVDNFTLVVPAPGSAALVGVAALGALRRRR